MPLRKYVLVSAVGDAGLQEVWMAGQRNFDVILIYYGNNDLIFSSLTSQAEIAIQARGQKLHLIAHLIMQAKIDLTGYDYVWFPDDDIAMDTESINKFFEANSRFKTFISQPAVVGYSSYWITKHQPQFYARSTSFIEVMAPCFEKEALATCLNSFTEEESGWGVDDLWWTLVGKPEKRLLIFDVYPMVHTRPIQAIQRFPNAAENAQHLRERYAVERKIDELGYLMYRGWWSPRWLAKLFIKLYGYKK